MPRKKRILSADPGTKNFGLCFLVCGEDTVKIHGTGMLAHPLQSLVAGKKEKQMRRFKKTFKMLIEKYKPDVVVVERFMARGPRTQSIELVSFMNGFLEGLCQFYGIEFRCIVASQWKNSIRRAYGDNALDGVYKNLGGIHIKPVKKRVPPHRADAALIGVYTGMGNDFCKFKLRRDKLIRQIRLDLSIPNQ